MGLYQNRVVVKVGTSILTNDLGKSDLYHIERLVRVLADINNMNYQVILVSSGAIAFGINKFGLKSRPKDLRTKQAASAVGQCALIYLYDQFFKNYDKTIAQILLSEGDLKQEQTRGHLINTFDTLLNMGVIPIVNENDSVGISEIESDDHLFGDNDLLSAMVAELCLAKRLIILSDIDGIYQTDPRVDPTAKPIEKIDRVDEKVLSYVTTKRSRRGAGGITTKLRAARYAANCGTDTIIMNGKHPESLYDIIKGKPIGTLITGR